MNKSGSLTLTGVKNAPPAKGWAMYWHMIPSLDPVEKVIAAGGLITFAVSVLTWLILDSLARQ